MGPYHVETLTASWHTHILRCHDETGPDGEGGGRCVANVIHLSA